MTVLSEVLNSGSFNRLVTGPASWFGKTDGTVGVSSFEAGGVAFLRATTKAAGTVVAAALNLGGTNFIAAATTGDSTLSAANNIVLDAETSVLVKHIASTVNGIQLDGTQLLLKYVHASNDVNAVALDDVSLKLRYPGNSECLEISSVGMSLSNTSGQIRLSIGTNLNLPNLPTSDPGAPGALWRDGAVVKISI